MSRSVFIRRSLSSLGVALRSEPRKLPASVDPVIGIGLARQPGDDSDLRSLAVSLDLPITFSDPLHPKSDASFCHIRVCPSMMCVLTTAVRLGDIL